MAFMLRNVVKKEDAFRFKLKFSGGNGIEELEEVKSFKQFLKIKCRN